MSNGVYLILGGDRRQSFLYEMFRNKNIEAIPFNVEGFENPVSGLHKVMDISDIIILPMPLTRDGKIVSASCGDPILLDDIITVAKPSQIIFAGGVPKAITEKAINCGISIVDYLLLEDLSVMNAIPTVEGAIAIAIDNTDFTLFNSKCLIAGFGRIGKLLAIALRSLGAEVHVAARKPGDLAMIKALQFIPHHCRDLKEAVKGANIIFNTAPAVLFTEPVLKSILPTALIIDLASIPGGIDQNFASALKIKTIHALSLPGKTAPKTAAEIIGEVIFHYLREENI